MVDFQLMLQILLTESTEDRGSFVHVSSSTVVEQGLDEVAGGVEEKEELEKDIYSREEAGRV